MIMLTHLPHRAWRFLRYGLTFQARRWHLISRVRHTALEARKKWDQAGEQDYLQLRARTLAFVNARMLPEHGPGAYAYQEGGPPLVYAACYAALTRHLYGELQTFTAAQKSAWAAYLQSFQCEDGLFRDPRLACSQAETCDWWGTRHLSLHALMALTALGAVARRPVALLEKFRAQGAIENWLEQRDWKREPNNASNEVQNMVTFMQYARDYQESEHLRLVIANALDWLEAHQDPATGFWGPPPATPGELSQGVQTGYHLWLLSFYERRPLRYMNRIIDSCLKTQGRFGGFGVAPNSSACEDIDSIDPLARLSRIATDRQQEIQQCLQRALSWVLGNFNPDGGWVFTRHEEFCYVHPLMRTAADVSSMFPTWFRSLSLAYLAKVLGEHPLSRIPWQFLESPGHQFWRPAEA